MEILRVDKLRKRYGEVWAIRDLSFTVSQGEVVGLLGQNGAGKSTAIRIICGLVRPTGGTVLLGGEPASGRDRAGLRRQLGAIVEAPRFYPQLSGRRNLQLLARVYRVDRPRVEQMLGQVGLAERAGDLFGRYSMGMKQRLGLAAVLLHGPGLIVLDEPTNGLDPVGSRQIQDLIGALAREHAVGVLLCSHQLDEVAALCHRALVMDRGELLLEQSLDGETGIQNVRNCFEDLARESTVH